MFVAPAFSKIPMCINSTSQVEDEEEADRRLAFEGNYDDQEGQGDSDSGIHNQGQESDGGLIEILDSSGDEENEQHVGDLTSFCIVSYTIFFSSTLSYIYNCSFHFR